MDYYGVFQRTSHDGKVSLAWRKATYFSNTVALATMQQLIFVRDGVKVVYYLERLTREDGLVLFNG